MKNNKICRSSARKPNFREEKGGSKTSQRRWAVTKDLSYYQVDKRVFCQAKKCKEKKLEARVPEDNKIVFFWIYWIFMTQRK